MTRRTFTVETRGQAVAIFGGPTGLTQKLVHGLLGEGIHAIKAKNYSDIEQLKESYDPDYLVVFADDFHKIFSGQGSSLLSELETLIDSGESRLIVVKSLNSKDILIPLEPVAKHISISDYVSEDELSSNVVKSWLENIEDDTTLTIPGDGLKEVSLLGENDLSKLLVKAILHPSMRKGEKFFLGNPTPISLLNLAYLVRTNLPFKVNLLFDQESEASLWDYDDEVLSAGLDKLDYGLTQSPEEILKMYLRSHHTEKHHVIPPKPMVKERKVVEDVESVQAVREEVVQEILEEKIIQKVPEPKPVEPKRSEPKLAPLTKKLSPLMSNQPVFVPLQSNRKKLKLNLNFPLARPSRPKHSGPPGLKTIFGRGLVIALALYLGTLAFTGTVAALSLNRIFTSLREGELPMSNKFNNFSVAYLKANYQAIASFPILNKNESVSDISLLLDAYAQSLSAFDTATLLSHSMQELTHYIFGPGSSDIAQLVSLSRLQSEELYQKLSLLDGALPADPPKIVEKKYKDKYLEVKTKLTKIKRSVTTTKAILATTPDVIGLGGRRKYAVLFQNNMELRATGGFIGSFAILSFENGKLYDMPIYDVYDADGQLKGHVEPPTPIKDILGEASWYLRDSNFDPDFPTSARRAEWFIKKSLNQDLDGTIAVNVNTLSSLLEATGPLLIPDYNETITKDNLYERAQFHAEVNFFPGSTQKKEFLSTVANALFTRLPELKAGEGIKLATALSDTVQEKNTLISMTNTTTDHVFQTLGWNGQINDYPCPTVENCHKDFAMVVDSNFGVNKANYFIKRNIEEVITFDKNLGVNHIMRINYQNTSTSTAWPAGAYKNYQRLYLPVGSNIVSVKIGGNPLDSSNYNIYSEHGKFIIAYLVNVPINSTTLVEVEYTTPQLTQENELIYTWYWQKQPGTSGDDSVLVYINYPMYLRPTVVSPQADLASQQLKFNFINDTDHRITVKFSK